LNYGDAIKALDARLAYIKSGKPMETAVRSVMAQMVVRIFEDGIKSDGSPIGQYNDSDELYVDPDTLPKTIAPRGKPGKERNVANRKTTYFKSYKALRSEVGRESGKVNIRLTNDLQSDWSNASVGDGIASNPKPKVISPTEYHIVLKRDNNADKRKGLESRYGDIFRLTKEEETFYFDQIRKEIALNA